ncbi:Hypothetical predicted protein [Drosophila guanche]|uniref:Uncharacterized protein n=1 Tax=Drosophila guanche TaxID=7266 RepID=A0A3B0K7V6_DROGU|nr:Hypothetical predicted protein [Drosophila guanche]
MLGIVFLLSLCICCCSAELGYQYQQTNAPPLNSYGAAAQDYGNEAASGDAGYPTLANEHYEDHADFHKHFYAFEAPYDSSEEADQVAAQASSLGYYPEQQPQPEQEQEQEQGYYPEPQSPPSRLPPGYSPASTAQSSYLPTPSPSTSYLPTPLPQKSYLPPAQQPSYLPRPQSSYLPPAPQSSYLPPPAAAYLPSLPNYASIAQGYNAAGAGSTLGQIDLPPLPEPQQDLGSNYDDLDERSGRSLRTGFRANERRRSGSRMVFPTELSSSNYYRSQQASRRRRRAHH